MIRFRVKELHRFTTESAGPPYGYEAEGWKAQSVSGVSLKLEVISDPFVPGSHAPTEILVALTEAEARDLEVGAWYTLLACPPPEPRNGR